MNNRQRNSSSGELPIWRAAASGSGQTTKPVIARSEATKQSRASRLSLPARDCFASLAMTAEFVIGGPLERREILEPRHDLGAEEADRAHQILLGDVPEIEFAEERVEHALGGDLRQLPGDRGGRADEQQVALVLPFAGGEMARDLG